VGVLTRGERREEQLIAIRARDTQQTTEKLEEKSFPAIHFPFRFPRPYLSPYLSLWGPLGTDPTRFNLDLSAVHEMWREACTGEWEELGELEVYDRLFPAPKNTKTKVHSAPRYQRSHC
jgi:hypothetical protein